MNNNFNLLILISSLFITSIVSSQQERFDIKIPFEGAPTVFTIDENGFIWFSKNKADYARYHGQGIIDLNLKDLHESKTNTFEIDNPVLIDGKLIIQTETNLSLLNLTDQSLEILWVYPKGHHVDYYLLDDHKNLIVFTSNKNEQTRPVYKRAPNGSMIFYYDLAEFIGQDKLSWWSSISMHGEETFIHGRRSGLVIIDRQGNQRELDLKDRTAFDAQYDCSLFRSDNKNNLWRIHKKTFSVYDPILRKFVIHPVSGKVGIQTKCVDMSTFHFELNRILIDQKNRIWFAGGQSNVFLYDPKTDEAISFSKPITDLIGGNGGDVHDLKEDQHGNIFGSKRGGLFKISERKQLFERYAVNTNDEAHAIYDYTGDPFFEQVVNYLKPNNIVKTNVNSIVEHNGQINFLDYRFLYQINKANKSTKVMPYYQPTTKIGLFNHNNKLLVAAWSELFFLDDNYQPEKLNFTPSRLEGLFQQKNGNTWAFGYLLQDLKTSNPSRNFFAKVGFDSLTFNGNYKDPNGEVNFGNTRVFDIVENSKGDLWLGTNKGIYKIGESDGIPKKQAFDFSPIANIEKFKEASFRQLSIIEDTSISLSTNSELAVIDINSNQVISYISVDDLGLSKLDGAVFPTKNEVWFGSNNGLGYYNYETQKFINFSHELGLNKKLGLQTIKILEDDRIALGTLNGLFIFDPFVLLDSHGRTEKLERNIPLEFIAYQYIDGKNGRPFISPMGLLKNQDISLNYNDKMLIVEMGLMHFTQPSQHLYSYKLEGYEKNWSIPTNDNRIKFTSLPPGNYTLKVKANLGNGIWSNDIKSIPIKVDPVWYKTWLSIGLFILLLAGLIYALFKHYLFLAKSKLDNIAKQKEANRLKELDVAKNIFFANISHEFRTPLTVIMGINENIDQHVEEKALIRRNSNHLLELVNQLLDLSKLESSKMFLNLSQGDIVAYLKYLTASFFSMAADKNIKLKFSTDLDSLVMNYDEIRIQQIVYNLLSNALKFTKPHGSVSLIVKLMNESEEPKLSIIVKDSGQGIHEDDLTKVFDHFYQVKNSTQSIGGSGIGLALVKELLTLMKGEIEVNSIVDVGTVFKISLPIHTELSEGLVASNFEKNINELNQVLSENDVLQDKDTTPEYSVALTSEINQELPVLLLIEDNADVTTYIISILKSQYQIIISENGALGIEKAIEIVPDIIISDVMMPIKDGYEVCAELKQHATTDHIPIILLTAKSTIDDKIEGLRFGADAYLHKPFNKEELHVRLEQLLLNRKKIQARFSKQSELPVTTEPSLEDLYYSNLKEVILKNLSNTAFGVPELAKEMFMSQTQLYRKTKAIIDQTPIQFIRSLRLGKAQELLLHTKRTIAEIAEQTGFRDPSYFSRAFSKEFGTSPSDFRK